MPQILSLGEAFHNKHIDVSRQRKRLKRLLLLRTPYLNQLPISGSQKLLLQIFRSTYRIGELVPIPVHNNQLPVCTPDRIREAGDYSP